jgi:hypothetical protein
MSNLISFAGNGDDFSKRVVKFGDCLKALRNASQTIETAAQCYEIEDVRRDTLIKMANTIQIDLSQMLADCVGVEFLEFMADNKETQTAS